MGGALSKAGEEFGEVLDFPSTETTRILLSIELDDDARLESVLSPVTGAVDFQLRIGEAVIPIEQSKAAVIASMRNAA